MDVANTILEILDEAQKKNYSRFTLEQDFKALEEQVNKEITRSYDEGFEEGFEECRDRCKHLVGDLVHDI